MSFCSQFKALFKKNFILWYRSLFGSLCELFFPVILGFILVLVRYLVANETVPTRSYIHSNNPQYAYYFDEDTAFTNMDESSWIGLYPATPFASCVRLERTIIGVVANDNVYTLLKEGFLDDLPKNFPSLTYQRFSTEKGLEDYVTNKEYEGPSMPGLCGGIVIEGTPGDYIVKLRYDDNRILRRNDRTQQIPNTQLPLITELKIDSEAESYRMYYTSGFTYLQYIITKILGGGSINKLKIGMLPMMTIEHVQDVFLDRSEAFLGYMIVLCYLAPIFRIVSMIVLDKELKTRDGMSMMGLKDSAYWLSFFVYYFIILFVIAILLATVMVLFLFRHTNWFLLMFFFLLFGFAVLSFGFFVSTFFYHSRIASITATMLYFASFMISDLVEDPTTSESAKLGASILPTVAGGLSTMTIGAYENARRNLGFSNASDKVKNYRFSMGLMMLAVDIVVYILLGLYFDNVLPSPSGVRKPFYYFLTKQYWTGKYEEQVKPVEKKEMLASQIKEDDVLYPNKYFEKVNEALQLQEEKSECLTIRDLNKFFGKKHSVCDFSVNMYKGQIFALLGPNGAGKTTTISMLSGLLPISSGQASFNGMAIFKEMSKVREKLGVCPQHDVLFENLTAKEHLEIFAAFKGRSDKESIAKDVEEILQDIELKGSSNMLARNLSGGERRKLSIGIAFIGDSEMIFLDEPTSGIDIAARKNVWAMLKKYKEGKVIIMTTHYMEEAEELGDRIGIMASGKLRCVGSPLFLKFAYGTGYNLIVVHDETKDIEQTQNNICEFIKRHIEGVSIRKKAGKETTYFLPKSQDNKLKDLFTDLDKNLHDLKIASYGMATNTLEDIFLRVAREDEGEEQKLNPNMHSLSINKEVESGNLETYTIMNEPEKSFWHNFNIHFAAIFLKRFLINRRNLGGVVMEILVPIILIIFGFALTRVRIIGSSNPRWFYDKIYGNPQSIIINTHSYVDNVPTSDLVEYFSDGLKADFMQFSGATGLDAMKEMDKGIFHNWDVNPNRYGSLFVNKLDDTSREYEIAIFVNISSQDSAGVFMGYFCQSILRKATGNPNYNILFANSPFPLSFRAKSRQRARNSNIVSITLIVSFALLPASIIVFIVREREENLKHQQLISGVSLMAYWLSNGAMDIFKSLIPCGVAIGMIYAFDVALPHGWILILVYGFTIIPFTYATSFFFIKENAAQTGSLLINFFMGVILSPVFTIFHMFDDTRPIAKYLGWIFRIVPSFCLAYGSNNISYKEVYARFEGKTAGDDLSFSVAGGDLLFLCILFPICIILIIMAEAQCFDFLITCCDPKELKENVTTTQKNELVLEEEKACDTKNFDDNPPAIMVRHLKKLYRISGSTPIVAVNDISFFINKGECLALLGTNGAGKTTTFKMITRDIFPSSGEIFINGMELDNNFNSIRKMIGYGPQYESAYGSLTVRENLDFYAKIKGIPSTISGEMISKLIPEMGLIEYQNILFGQLSGGNKRKTTAAIALLGNPPIVLLDELSTGVDPQAKRFMWQVIQRISTKNKNTAVILTTHSMEEAEYLCTKMAIMVAGSFCCIGTPQELKEAFGKGFEIQISMPLTIESEEREFLKGYHFDVNQEIEYKDVIRIFQAVDCANLEEQLKCKGNAAHIMTEIEHKMTVKARLVASFIITHLHAMEIGNKLADEFDEVRVPEWIGNFYKFRVDKTKPHHTIGFLFGVVQDIANKYKISQYSASQTSLNQIFQTFAKQVEVILVIIQ